jgi:hypothetical protein
MLTFSVVAGNDLIEIVRLRDRSGNAVTSYTDAATLELRLNRGDDQAAIALSDDSTAEWATAGEGTVRITLAAADTATLEAGDYDGFLTVIASGVRAGGRGPLFQLRVEAQPGSASAPRSYVGRDDLTSLASGWVDDLMNFDVDETNFAEQRREASRWLDEQIMARAERDLDDQRMAHSSVVEVDAIVPTSGVDYGPGWGRSVLPDTTTEAQLAAIQARLDDDGLVLDSRGKRIVARMALHFILAPQLGEKDKTPYQQLAAMHRATAIRELAGWVARVYGATESEDDTPTVAYVMVP